MGIEYISNTNEVKIISSNGNEAVVNDSGQLKVVLDGKVSTENSSSTPLAAGEIFQGTSLETLDYAMIFITVYSDVASATDGLCTEVSSDGITWRESDCYAIPADKEKTFSFQPAKKYLRVKYTNGGTDQTVFDLQTVFKKTNSKPSSHRIQDSIITEDDATLVKAVISGEDDTGVFRNAKVDSTGRVQVVSQPYTYSIAEGTIPDHSPLLKFGTRSATTTAQSTIWEGPTALYTYMATAQQLKITSASANDIATTGTGARTLFIQGLDANYDEISETINMNGLTAVTTSNSYLRVFRSYVASSGSSYTNTGDISIKNNASTVTQAIIKAGDSQTLMSLWTVPNGATAYITNGTFSTNSNKGSRVSFFTRLNDGIVYPWRIQYRAYVFSGNENFNFNIPFKIPAKTDIEVRATQASVGADCGATFELWYEF